MRARRTSLLATSVALAMLAVTASGATAVDDDSLPTGATTFERDADAPLVPAQPGLTLDDLTSAGDRSDSLQAASGTAAVVLGALNVYRANAGMTELVEDDAISAVSTAWSVYSSNNQTLAENPNIDAQIPGSWWDGGEVVAELDTSWWGASGWEIAEALLSHPDPVEREEINGILLNPAFTHVGVGWSGDSRGHIYLTLDVVEYDFRDVGPSHGFHSDIVWLVDSGVTTGFADRTYRPTAGVSRQAMAAFLYRWRNPGAADPTCSGPVRLFSDVPSSSDFCGVIEWLAGSGITGGYADGTFRPTAPVTRQAVSAFIYRVFEGIGADATCDAGPRTFNDVGAENGFCGEIEWLADTGITAGYADGGFHPAWGMSRQAMARFIYKAEQYENSQR